MRNYLNNPMSFMKKVNELFNKLPTEIQVTIFYAPLAILFAFVKCKVDSIEVTQGQIDFVITAYIGNILTVILRKLKSRVGKAKNGWDNFVSAFPVM